jgi:hypothetical protein
MVLVACFPLLLYVERRQIVLTQEVKKPMLKASILAALTVCLSIAVATPSASMPLPFGRADENKAQAEHQAQEAILDMGLNIQIDDANILRIGSSYAVDQDEVVDGDVIIVGGALTVEGTINGDAAVIGGSMYLASTAVVRGDAVVIGGIIEKEDGATVVGKTIENPEKEVNLDRVGESDNLEIVGEVDLDEMPEARTKIREAGGSDGDIVKIGEDVHIGRGDMVDGDVVTVGSDIMVDGTVDGDVVATSGDISVGRTARITGDVVSIFGDVSVEEGASVDGDVVKIDLTGKSVIIKGEGISKGVSSPGIKAIEKAKAAEMVKKSGTVRYRISLNRPEAKDIRLTGSFIGWDPEGIRMTVDEEGTWSTYYDFPAGTHLYKFIVDGQAIPDPDEPGMMVDDGMGGKATQIVVIPPSSDLVPIKFSLFRPQADDVRVTGSFNSWDREGIRMAKDQDGTWAVTVPIAPGVVLYRFYIDGEWGPDPDVAETADDGMGGRATKFVVKPKPKSFTFTTGSRVMERKGTNITPAIDYNRVDGFYLALVASNKSNVFPMPRFYLEGGHSWRRDRWLYTFEIEQPVLAPFMLSVGGSFYDKTDSYDKEIISDDENFISSAFVKRDYRDYFDRRGVNGFVAVRPLPKVTLKVGYTSDDYRPLETLAHAALFRRNSEFAPNPHNPAVKEPRGENPYQICYNPDTESMTCDMLTVKSVEALCELDTRDCCDSPTTGIWTRLSGEWAGRDFGGDLDYSRYIADLRFYNRISSKQKYAIRVKFGGMTIPDDASCPCIPGPEYFFPKQFYVGGIGTMPGYDYKEFRGTHMILMNVEYVLAFKSNMGLLFFADGGDARGQGESTSDVIDAMKIKYDAGVGVRLESGGDHMITLGVAKRLDDSDEPVLVTMRASRPF